MINYTVCVCVCLYEAFVALKRAILSVIETQLNSNTVIFSTFRMQSNHLSNLHSSHTDFFFCYSRILCRFSLWFSFKIRCVTTYTTHHQCAHLFFIKNYIHSSRYNNSNKCLLWKCTLQVICIDLLFIQLWFFFLLWHEMNLFTVLMPFWRFYIYLNNALSMSEEDFFYVSACSFIFLVLVRRLCFLLSSQVLGWLHLYFSEWLLASWMYCNVCS